MLDLKNRNSLQFYRCGSPVIQNGLQVFIKGTSIKIEDWKTTTILQSGKQASYRGVFRKV